MIFPQIVLKSNRDEAVRRFHPWVFSGAIGSMKGQPADGDIVEVVDNRNKYLATGHYHNGNIAVKIFSFEKIVPDVAFWKQKLQNALTVRKVIFADQSDNLTNCYRLIHGEGDGLRV